MVTTSSGSTLLASSHTSTVGTILDRQLLRRRMVGVDAVIHAATLHKPHVPTHDSQAFVDTNVSGTLNLLEEAAAAGVGAFVLHEYHQCLRSGSPPATGRAGGMGHRGGRPGATEHLRRDQGCRRGPL